MAYNQGYPMTYNPYYTYQTAQTSHAQTQTAQGNTSPVWVQGESGAKSYLVAPNSSVMLMDSEGAFFYMKSADAMGMPTLKKYRFEEVEMGATQTAAKEGPDMSAYMTKEEAAKLFEEMFKKHSTTSKKGEK